ncbi:hypothetical protein PQ469_06530 [Mucilaginibacter sp. KACC 22773]|uniref:hypothetical protein n=1 Tax=Mucilaginibacter sp. KACC 22773 TaxID=3025671 RepID=UPI0023652E16|nr:hypothetical protein [Mucilaginibacter sp. KACC 22773]WDF79661.1 hypothetical protein PQ469_06530 [Mucilaginibacter sp. KACC 22773]
MKLPYILFLSILLASCDQSYMNKPIDNRPATELSLIKRLSIADSAYDASENEIKKTEAIEKGKSDIAKFIIDTLHSDVKEWPAIVHEIRVVQYPINYIDVTLLISKGITLDEKYPNFNAVVLNAKVDQTDSVLKNSLKELLRGDTVLVNGFFEKDVNENIDFTGYSIGQGDKEAFSNPSFNFTLKKITKKGK